MFVFLEVPLDHINLILRGTRDGSIRPLRTFSLMLISNRTSSITCISPVRVYVFLVFSFWFVAFGLSVQSDRERKEEQLGTVLSVCVWPKKRILWLRLNSLPPSVYWMEESALCVCVPYPPYIHIECAAYVTNETCHWLCHIKTISMFTPRVNALFTHPILVVAVRRVVFINNSSEETQKRQTFCAYILWRWNNESESPYTVTSQTGPVWNGYQSIFRSSNCEHAECCEKKAKKCPLHNWRVSINSLWNVVVFSHIFDQKKRQKKPHHGVFVKIYDINLLAVYLLQRSYVRTKSIHDRKLTLSSHDH